MKYSYQNTGIASDEASVDILEGGSGEGTAAAFGQRLQCKKGDGIPNACDRNFGSKYRAITLSQSSVFFDIFTPRHGGCLPNCGQ